MVKDALAISVLASASFADVDANFFVQLLVSVSASVFLANQIKAFFRPTAAEQIDSAKGKLVSKEECASKCGRLDEKVGNLDAEYDARLTAMSGHSANSRKAVYDSLNKLALDMSAVKKADEFQTQRICEISLKLDRLIERSPQK